MKSLKKLLNKLVSVFPTKTPIGATAFDLWATGILDTFGFPNTPGYRQALATMLMHEKGYFVSKLRLVIALRKGEVNETAYHIMKDIQQQKKLAEQSASQEKTEGSESSTNQMVQ